MLEVVLSPSFGAFEPNKKLEKFLKSLGYTDFENIRARVDQHVVGFVKEHIGTKLGINAAFLGKEKHQYLTIETVDTSKLWTIDHYDGAEYIRYLVIEVVDPDFNYCKLISN